GGLRLLRCLPHLLLPCPSQVVGRSHQHTKALLSIQCRVLLHAHWGSRHNHRALDAVLSSIGGGREGHQGEGLHLFPLGCHRGLHHHGRGGLFHHRSLRGDNLH